MEIGWEDGEFQPLEEFPPLEPGKIKKKENETISKNVILKLLNNFVPFLFMSSRSRTNKSFRGGKKETRGTKIGTTS